MSLISIQNHRGNPTDIFPQEIFCYMLSFLDLESWGRAHSVNKRWNELAKKVCVGGSLLHTFLHHHIWKFAHSVKKNEQHALSINKDSRIIASMRVSCGKDFDKFPIQLTTATIPEEIGNCPSKETNVFEKRKAHKIMAKNKKVAFYTYTFRLRLEDESANSQLVAKVEKILESKIEACQKKPSKLLSFLGWFRKK